MRHGLGADGVGAGASSSSSARDGLLRPLVVVVVVIIRGGAGDVPFFGGRGRGGRLVVGPPGGIVSGIVDADRSGARGAEALLNFGKDDGSHGRAAGLHYGSGEEDVFQMVPI